MRILIVGAGALGSYFGACLLHAGRDVTFLVRPARAGQLTAGLRVQNADGGFTVPAPTLVASALNRHFDLVLVAVKAYSLAAAMQDCAPAIGPDTMVLPVLNGLAHIDSLTARFGAGPVLGGMTLTGPRIEPDGSIVLQSVFSEIVFGERDGSDSARIAALAGQFAGSAVTPRASSTVMQDMWEKFTFLAAGSALSCLMRVSLGDMLATPGAPDLIARACAEARQVATACGFPPRQAYVERVLGLYATAGSPLKASMLHDIERGAPTEGEHVIGDMVARARRYGIATPVLDIAYCHVRAYEVARARIAAAG